MSESLSQTFLAITRNSTDLEWLQGALAPLGQVVSAGGGSLDELLALVDVTFANRSSSAWTVKTSPRNVP